MYCGPTSLLVPTPALFKVKGPVGLPEQLYGNRDTYKLTRGFRGYRSFVLGENIPLHPTPHNLGDHPLRQISDIWPLWTVLGVPFKSGAEWIDGQVSVGERE